MQHLTIITGKQGSGKSSLAFKMTSTKNAVWVNRLSERLLRNYLTEKTEVIILDEIADLPGTVRTLESMIKKGFIRVSTPEQNVSITREIPEIILVSQCGKENISEFILKNSNIISL